MKSRSENREYAMQVLYAGDVSYSKENTNISALTGIEDKDMSDLAYGQELITGVEENKEKIDAIMAEHSQHWKLNRISPIDKNILRIAIYELIFRNDVPFKVVIDEACELSKKYGDEKSSSFINGVLDSIHKKNKK